MAVPRFTQEHEFLGYIGTAFDITSERKMFYTLEEEKRKYEMISNKSADIIFLINKNGIIEYVSPSINRILGYTEKETIGKSFFSLQSRLILIPNVHGVLNKLGFIPFNVVTLNANRLFVFDCFDHVFQQVICVKAACA